MVAIQKIDPQHEETVRVYPYGFKFRQELLLSQKMEVLDAPPEEGDSQTVAVYASYIVADEVAFWAAVDKVPGRYILYQPVDG